MRYCPFSLLGLLVVASVSAQPGRMEPDPEPEPLPLPPPLVKPLALKAPPEVPQPGAEEVAAISKLLRDMALEKMPDPLLQAHDGWGQQKEFAVGRILLRNPQRVPEWPRELFNDGLWRRFTISPRAPEKTFALGITDLVKPAPDTMHLTINVAMDINFKMEQQLWKRGLRLYSGETRGHCQGAVQLKVRVVSKTVPKPGSFFPDVLLTITTHDAKIFYDKIVIDHTAGLDGQPAQAIGDLVIDLIKTIKPDLERQLLEKGNAAIVKAAGTKEVKVELNKLMKSGVMPKNGSLPPK